MVSEETRTLHVLTGCDICAGEKPHLEGANHQACMSCGLTAPTHYSGDCICGGTFL